MEILLFGAGASAFSDDRGANRLPPLGAGLFTELGETEVVSRLSPSVRAGFDELDFETAMARLRKEQSELLDEFQRAMAEYFLQFEPGPGNLYRRAVERAALAQNTLIATTNYDLLIELAAERSGYDIAYDGRPAARGLVRILKLHGSCNFFPDTPGVTFTRITFVGNPPATMISAPAKAFSAAQSWRFVLDETWHPPVLAMYAARKQVLACPEFVQAQQSVFNAEVSQADRIVVIGLRPNRDDEHIWGTLAQSAAQIEYVGLPADQGMFRDWAGTTNTNGQVLGDTFADVAHDLAPGSERPLWRVRRPGAIIDTVLPDIEAMRQDRLSKWLAGEPERRRSEEWVRRSYEQIYDDNIQEMVESIPSALPPGAQVIPITANQRELSVEVRIQGHHTLTYTPQLPSKWYETLGGCGAVKADILRFIAEQMPPPNNR